MLQKNLVKWMDRYQGKNESKSPKKMLNKPKNTHTIATTTKIHNEKPSINNTNSRKMK